MDKITKIRNLLSVIDQCNSQIEQLTKVLNEGLYMYGFSHPFQKELPPELAQANKSMFESIRKYYIEEKGIATLELECMALPKKHND